MRYDPDARSLSFTHAEEAERFHAEVTALLREAVTAASRHGDAEAGKAAAREVFKQYASVLRCLNAMRDHLTPQGQ